MLQRLLRGRQLPRLSTVVFAVLLLSMTGLTVVSTIVFRHLDAQRARTADEAIREYASLGARLFGDRAFGVFEGSRLRILASIYGKRLAPGEPWPSFERFVDDARAEMDAIGFAVGDHNRGFFIGDTARGLRQAVGIPTSSDVANRIREVVRSRPPAAERRQEPAVGLLFNLPEAVGVAWTPLRDAAGREVAYFGYTYTRQAGWRSVGDAVIRDLPLLPSAYISPGFRYGTDPSHTDTLIAIRLIDAAGRVLYDSRPPFTASPEGEFTYNTGSGAFRAVATLHPSLVAELRRSLKATRAQVRWNIDWFGLHKQVPLPFDALLPITALLLAVVAAIGLWREQRLTRVRRDFVASVSHELRTPLAQIRMFTETLQLRRERDEEERARWLNIVGREARRLGDLVENILLFSHIDADRAKVETERTDLGELIEEIVEGYVPVAQRKGMRIVADAPSRIFSMVDPRAMRQVIVNLLDNALKYGPKGQVVTIELERVGNVARIVVRDQGPGIRPADRKRIWEPFVRLGDRGTTGGSGIGLAVVKDLVELHGATITVDDAPSGGARFTLEFAVSESAEGLPLRATGEFRVRPAVATHTTVPSDPPTEG